jgi:hypothetical protein
MSGAPAMHALRQALLSIALPQHSSAGTDALMLSQGCETETAQALATGPMASQKASNAIMTARFFSTADRLSVLGKIGQTKVMTSSLRRGFMMPAPWIVKNALPRRKPSARCTSGHKAGRKAPQASVPADLREDRSR